MLNGRCPPKTLIQFMNSAVAMLGAEPDCLTVLRKLEGPSLTKMVMFPMLAQ